MREKPAVYVLSGEAIRCCQPAAPVALPAIGLLTFARLALVGLLVCAGALAAQSHWLASRPALFGSAAARLQVPVAWQATSSRQFALLRQVLLRQAIFRPRGGRMALARQARHEREARGGLTRDARLLALAALQPAAGKSPEAPAGTKAATDGAPRDGTRAKAGGPPRALGPAILLASFATAPTDHAGGPAAWRETWREDWREETYSRPVVVDGRTLVLGGVTARLAGIDLPGPDETCRLLDGSTAPCAARSATQLELMLRWRPVTCRVPDAPHGDFSTRCRVGAIDLAEWLVRNGWVRPAGDGPAPLLAAARLAQQQKAGLWREPPRQTPASLPASPTAAIPPQAIATAL